MHSTVLIDAVRRLSPRAVKAESVVTSDGNAVRSTRAMRATRGTTSIAEHAAAVDALLDTLPTRERTLAVTAAGVARHPGRTRGRRLGRDVTATIDVPRFDNSQMDGYAVRAADTADATAERPVALPVAAPIAAGDAATPLPPGTAAPIMTGAPIPAGADAVIPIERTAPGRFDAPRIELTAPITAGTFVRPRGADVAAGQLVGAAGTPVRPAHLGAFAAAGITEIVVTARPRVLVVTTGRELADGAGPARIPDAIGGMLCRAVTDAGARARAVVCPSDDPDELRALLRREADTADLVVTVGGVSRGAYEVVKLAFEGGGVAFVHLGLQPGGPQGIGEVELGGRRLPLLALPGNPVSALISFELFLRPWLRRRAGLVPAHRPVERRALAVALDSAAHQHQIRRGRVREDGRVEPVGGPGSHLISHYAAADCLLHVPVGVTRIEAGDEVEVWLLDE